MEIEKKFLVRRIPDNLNQYTKKKIKQAYISVFPTIRIRQVDDRYVLTIKGSGHMVREEFELDISKEEYENLLKKTEHNIVEKERYLIPLEDGLTAELDIYHGYLEGLYTVEVEFEKVDICDSFIPPDWFGEDVTIEKRYKNSNLSMLRNIDSL